MKYCYKVEVDFWTDAWNWYDATQHISYGYNWRNSLKTQNNLDIYDAIRQMTEDEAYDYLRPILTKKYQTKQFTDYQTFLKAELSNKFEAACRWLVGVTKRELFVKEITLYLVTFPKSSYNYGDGGWTMIVVGSTDPVRTLLHEMLHFQFHHYWRDDPKSPVAKLSNGDFHYLKEALTVIIDDDVKPLVKEADRGYPAHQDFRKLLHRHWVRYHVFDKLVDYGLRKLPEYTKN